LPPRIPRSSDDSDTPLSRARAPRGRCLTIAAGAIAALGVVVPAAGAGSSGGTAYVASPKPSKVKCMSSCSRNAVRGGGALKVSGKQLAGVKKVIFVGRRGARDDVEVAVDPASDRAIKLKVPVGAQSGPLMLWATERIQAKTVPVKIMPPPPPMPSAALSPSNGPGDPGAPGLETGTSSTKLFHGSRGGIEFKYRVGGSNAVNAQVNLVRQNDGTIVQAWNATGVAPGTVQSVRWDGQAADGGVAPEGRYIFLLNVTDGSGLQARSAAADNPQRDAFDHYHHVFPIRGRHNYGQSGARFGAGRSGHTHQGQDVMAGCGTRLVAARGGIVKFSGYHSAAGNYVVIDQADGDVDNAYMHLAEPSPLKEGDRVYTNQQIGVVGTTGSSTACHLHFEMWSAPGWYDGGSPFDPLEYLQYWDSYS
jgi:murein DD-endopeptidase MepM/ murein hydrolase activator NlpD